MRTLYVLFTTLFLLSNAEGSDRNEEKIALQKLVDEREARFGDYSRAAAAKTGFFGNKTKSDLKKQVEVLTEIIKTDNRIISLLKNFLDYRSYQKTELVYSQSELEERNRQLDELTDKLTRDLAASETRLKALERELKRADFLNWLLAAGIAFTVWLWWKGRRKAG